jgi:hypothetical protein
MNPMGAKFSSYPSLRGEKFFHAHPLIEEFPSGNGDKGPVDILRLVTFLRELFTRLTMV